MDRLGRMWNLKCGMRNWGALTNSECEMRNELAGRDEGWDSMLGVPKTSNFTFRIPNFESRQSRANLARDYFSRGADLRSHSATPLRPTCLSKAARMRRNEAS